MKNRSWVPILVLGLLGCRGASDQEVRLAGSGASFPFQIYQEWFKSYGKAHPNVHIDYQARGSGAGIKDFTAETVDFAASDAAMTKEEMSKVGRGAICLPLTAGAIILAYNVDGVDNLKLSRKAYAGIFNGTITKWDDPEIAKANPGAKLPKTEIAVVVRADASGTTDVFTKHLAAISEEFKKAPGPGTSPAWVCKCTKSQKNDGVTGSLNSTPGSIGYIEYSYLKTGKNLKQAALENKEGAFVTATSASSKATLDQTVLPEDMIVWNSDPTGKGSYPIVTYTWLLCYESYKAKAKMDTLKDVIKYCLHDGQKVADSLGYLPLPESTVSKAEKALDRFKLEKHAARGGWSAGPFASIQAR
jgi:phosphate transport system substrate-binding protein